MTRLARSGAVLQPQPGYYRAFLDASDLARFEAPLPAVHHVHLHLLLPQNGVTLPGAPAGRQAVLDGAAPGGWREIPENGSRIRDMWFEGRKLTVTIHEKARSATVVMEASKAPLDGPTWTRFMASVNGMFQAWGLDADAMPVRVTQFDVNVDLHALRIDGASSISLRRFSDGFLRAYNKADRLRFEVASYHPCRPEEITTLLETFYDRSVRADPPALAEPRAAPVSDPGAMFG